MRFEPYTIAVPHQRPAYLVEGAMPDAETADLHAGHYIASLADEDFWLGRCAADCRERPHQWARVRTLILERREATGRPTSYAAIRRNSYYDGTTCAPQDSVVAVADTAEEARRLAAAQDQEPDSRGLIELSHGQYAPDRGEVAEIAHEVPEADLWAAIELAGCEDAAYAAAAAWQRDREPLDPDEPTQGWVHANDDAFRDVAAVIAAETGLELIGSDDGDLYLVRTLA